MARPRRPVSSWRKLWPCVVESSVGVARAGVYDAISGDCARGPRREYELAAAASARTDAAHEQAAQQADEWLAERQAQWQRTADERAERLAAESNQRVFAVMKDAAEQVPPAARPPLPRLPMAGVWGRSRWRSGWRRRTRPR